MGELTSKYHLERIRYILKGKLSQYLTVWQQLMKNDLFFPQFLVKVGREQENTGNTSSKLRLYLYVNLVCV